jgi:hypothetical protein
VADVFISYSRRDAAFVQCLTAGLIAQEKTDGELVLTSGDTRQPLLTLPGRHARFAPTGHRLATAVGSEVWVWDCDVCGSRGELLALAEERDGRPLTAEERRTYLQE